MLLNRGGGATYEGEGLPNRGVGATEQMVGAIEQKGRGCRTGGVGQHNSGGRGY